MSEGLVERRASQNLLLVVGRVDPLFRVMRKVLRSSRLVFFVASALHLAVWAIVGLVVEVTHRGEQFYGLFSPKELCWGPFLFGILIPSLWTYYAWLPQGVLDMIRELYSNGVVDWTPEPEGNTPSDQSSESPLSLMPLFSAALGRLAWTLCAFGGTFFAVIAIHAISLPVQLGERGRAFFAVTWWSRSILVLINAISLYVGLQVTVRAGVSALTLRRFFGGSELKALYLEHPDGSAGMGSVGRLATRLAYFAVLVGFWAAFLTVLPVIAGGKPNFSIPVIALYCLYVLLVPLTLAAVTIPAHHAMKRFKHQRQQVLSSEIQELMGGLFVKLGADLSGMEEDIDSLQDLRSVYRLVEEIPEWPISIPKLRIFSGFAIVPGLLALVSLVADLMQLLPVLR